MKRRDLEKRLRHAGCYLKREGGHTLVDKSKDGGGGGRSSARRNQGAARLEDPEVSWSKLTRPNYPVGGQAGLSVSFAFRRHLPGAPQPAC